jgi:hypothetical protein
MALATLSIDLVAKLASFEADMGKAARAAEKTASQISGAFGLIKSAAGGLVAGIGVGGLVAFTRSTVDALDALNDVKDATGASIENISALEDVAVRTGTTLDVVTGSLIKLNQTLGAAKEGSAQAAALQAIGLSAEELRRLDPAEALRQTAVALAGFADDGNKARLVQELFGKSLREVAPFLGDLAKQTELVGKVTAEQVAEAEKFNLQLFEMQKNVQDLSRTLVGPLVSALNDTAAAFRDAAKDGKGFFEIGWDRYVSNVRKFYEELGILKSRAPKFLVDYSGENESAAESARLARRRSVEFSGAPGTPKTGPKAKTPEGVSAVTTELDRYLASLEQTIEREQELTAVQTAQLRISEAGANGFSEAQRARILALAAEIDKQRELKDAMKAANEAQEDRIRIGREVAISQGVDNSARADQLRALLSGTDEERFAKIREDVALLAEEFSAGRLVGGAEQYIQAIQRAVGETGEAIEKTKTLSEELGLSFTSAFEDAIVGGKALSDLLKGLEQDIIRIVTRKFVTKPLTDALGGMLDGGGGGFLGGISKFIGGLFSADGGGFTGTGARAGGLDGRGGFLGVLHPNETVLDHTRGQTGASTQQYITINPPAGMSRQASSQFAADVARQLRLADARNN